MDAVGTDQDVAMERRAILELCRYAVGVLGEAGDTAGGAADDDAERGADLERAGRVVDRERRALCDQGVARLDVKHRRLRRRLVRRLVGGVAERRKGSAVVHQDAVDRAREAVRGEVERQVEGQGHRLARSAQGRGETPNAQRCAQKIVTA